MLRTSSTSVRHDAVPKDRVVAAARAWYEAIRKARPEVVRAGFFGSYARGDYVPGSDFDVLLEVTSIAAKKWRDRPDDYRPDRFPVTMNLFVYATDELTSLRAEGRGFLRTIEPEIVWL